MWHFLRSCGTVCCRNIDDNVYRKVIRAHLSFLKQHGWNLISLFFWQISDNQWQNIIKILKSNFKIPRSLNIMLRTQNIAWCKFFSLFLNIAKRGKNVETQNRSNSCFSRNFFTDCLKKFKELVVAFSSCLFYIKLKACNYSLRHNFAMVSHYLNNRNIIWHC